MNSSYNMRTTPGGNIVIEEKSGVVVAALMTNGETVPAYDAIKEAIARAGGTLFDTDRGVYIVGSVSQLDA